MKNGGSRCGLSRRPLAGTWRRRGKVAQHAQDDYQQLASYRGAPVRATAVAPWKASTRRTSDGQPQRRRRKQNDLHPAPTGDGTSAGSLNNNAASQATHEPPSAPSQLCAKTHSLFDMEIFTLLRGDHRVSSRCWPPEDKQACMVDPDWTLAVLFRAPAIHHAIWQPLSALETST